MKVFALLLTTSLLLIGCSDKQQETSSVDDNKVEGTLEVVTHEEPTENETTNEEETTKTEKTEDVTAPVVEIDNSLTRAKVDALFSVDPDETQYENGQLEFKQGEIVEVDYISYLGTDGIDYVSAMFFEDELVNIQLDTTLSDEVLEKRLGIDINEDLLIEDMRERGVYEITFNDKFNESEIARYPFEMD